MKRFIALLAGLVVLFSVAGCGKKNENEIVLWAWGDTAEVTAFESLMREYNDTNPDGIYVNFTKKGDNYYTALERALGGRQPPDLFYVGDSMVKRYARDGLMVDLTEYIRNSTEIDLDDIWPTLTDLYRFDAKSMRSSDDAPIWGLPKDVGPVVVFYNEDAFAAKGIKVISAADEDGDGKVTYGGAEYDARGFDPEAKVFNNQIAVTWDESGASDFDKLNALLSAGKTAANPNAHLTQWSFYSSWWFNFGWSVGGDCMQFAETPDNAAYNDGYWEFTLDDTRPNYKVLADDVEIDGKKYGTDDFVDYYSLGYMESNKNGSVKDLIDAGKIVETPSIRNAFEYWVKLFQNGYSPKPEDISTERALFTNQQVAMFCEGRYNVVDFRKNCKFGWDVAPLPVYKDGVEANHSGSMCLSMGTKSKDKEKSFKVMEYLCGKIGQDALAATGFNVPTQMSLAKDPNANFLGSTERPYNNQVFLKAAERGRGGDWTYVADDVWISLWAPTLNTDVLNGKMTVEELFNRYKSKVNDKLKTYTEKK